MTPPSGATRSFAFLVNPASGGGAAPEAVVPVARVLRDAGATVDVTYSPGPSASRSLVAEAVERGDVVVSVGGDGMLASLVGQVASLGGVLGVVPAGRGNDFARMLGIPDEPQARAEVLLRAVPREIDLLEVGGAQASTVVAGSVYAGVDARAAAYVDRMSAGRLRRLPSSWQYRLAAVRALATYTPAHYRLVLDGTEHRFDGATVVVANSRYYGNGMAIAPDASIDDGLLDVIVIEAASKRDLIRSLPKVYDGSHVDLLEVTVLRGAKVELSTVGSVEVPVGGDGEPLGVLPCRLASAAAADADPMTVRVMPGALSVLHP